MKKVVKKTTEKYVTMSTFEKSMASIAKSFSIVTDKLDQHENALGLILKEIRQIHQDNTDFRKNMASLTIDGISYDKKIEGLTIRLEKLEAKSK